MYLASRHRIECERGQLRQQCPAQVAQCKAPDMSARSALTAMAVLAVRQGILKIDRHVPLSRRILWLIVLAEAWLRTVAGRSILRDMHDLSHRSCNRA